MRGPRVSQFVSQAPAGPGGPPAGFGFAPGTDSPLGAAPPRPARVGTVILSPFVGTFYRAPAPDAAPFADIGQRVTKGQTLCIVEAMKLMNEIESEVDGVVREILVENAQPVEFGQELFVIAPA